MYLIGIDIGTTHTKLGVYNTSGDNIFLEKFLTPFILVKGIKELDGRLLVNSILDTLKKFFSLHGEYKDQRGFLSVSSIGETVIPVDEKGNTLDRGLIWYDRRTIPVYEEILERFGKEYFIENLLKNPGYFYSINKILWFRREKSNLFSQVKWFLPVSSYVIFSLTGEGHIDYSHAVRTMVLNPYTMDWDYKLLSNLELYSSIFPPIVRSGMYIGKLKGSLKSEIGIRDDIYISSGGHDHLVAALSVGLFRKNVLFNSSGTTESLFLGVEMEDINKLDIFSFLQKGDLTCHTVPGLFTLITSMGTGGIVFKWFVENLLNRDIAYISSSLLYKKNKVFFMPRLLEVHDSIPMSGFLSLDLEDDVNTLYSSIVESLVFEMKDRANLLENTDVKLPSVIRVSGGPSVNSVYNQLKSDLFEKIVEIPKNKEATLFGAALLGGIGGGVYKRYEEAFEETYKVEKIYNPHKNIYLTDKYLKYKMLKKRYDKIYQIF